ncbi:MAG: hypothetical protein RL407_89 [Bacteroidota bacterium]|jgi:uncharacterized protein
MHAFLDWLSQPWPWYIAGPLIGLTVPALLLVGNKAFGISSSLRHICAACIPAGIPFFTYDWKKEIWNLLFVMGTALGGWIAVAFMGNPESFAIAASTKADLIALGITNFSEMMPSEIFSWENLFTGKGIFFFVIGGFLVGFGTRYAGGCTSGHAIMGISSLQWPSLVATICFMLGGFLMTQILLAPLMQFLGF